MHIPPAGVAGLSPGAAGGPGSPPDSPAKIHQAASQFEALLIAQLLKGAQGEGEGWLGEPEDPAAASARAFANEYLAGCLAAQGGLGLGRVIGKSLEHAANSANHATPVRAPSDTPSPGH